MINKNLQLLTKSKAGALTEAEFFEKLVERSDYMDPAQVKRVYWGLKDLIFNELKGKGIIELPELCDIYLTQTKPKVVKNRFMAAPVVKEAHHQVRMVPKRSMKHFFRVLEGFYEGRVFDAAVRAGLK